MDPKNILISVDASENATRAVAYAATLLGGQAGVRVTLLYVERMPPRDLYRSEEPSISKTILEVQQEGGYGTLVVGRRGITKGEEFLFGSVSSKLVHNARDCAVWVVQ